MVNDTSYPYLILLYAVNQQIRTNERCLRHSSHNKNYPQTQSGSRRVVFCIAAGFVSQECVVCGALVCVLLVLVTAISRN
jgi:hypothetical protein